MIDMTQTIVPKSDQMNSDDLIGKTKTIKITKVSLLGGDQPVGLNYDGDEGKPYKPCKSMRRVLVNVWGSDGNAYVGRTLTLYRDEKVAFGGMAVGGIRISHMSDIDNPVTMSLTAARASKKPFTVEPLSPGVKKVEPTPEQKKAAAKKKCDEIIALIGKCDNDAELKSVLDKNSAHISRFENGYSELSSAISETVKSRRSAADFAESVDESNAEEELPL